MDLLDRLRKAPSYVSGEALAEEMGVTRAAVYKQIKKLRGQGHVIRGTNRVGYRLEKSKGDRWSTDMFPGPLGRPLHHFSTLGSTQDEAKTRALRGEAAGGLVVADTQSKGRGRLGRAWSSGAGGLWCTLLLRPRLRPAQVGGLVLVAAWAWAELLRERAGLDAAVKWPNDVWVGRKKVAGILAEMSSEMDRVHWVVLGMGLNMNNTLPAALKTQADTLKNLMGSAQPRVEWLSRWLTQFATHLHAYEKSGFSVFRDRCQNQLVFKSQKVSIDSARGRLSGVLKGLDEDGRLLLETETGLLTLEEGVLLLP